MDGSERTGIDIEALIEAAERMAAALSLSLSRCLDSIMSVIEEFSRPLVSFGYALMDGYIRGLNPPLPDVFSIDGISYSLVYSCLPRFRAGDLDSLLARAGLLQPGETRRASHVAPQRSLVLPRYRRSYHRRMMAPNRKGSDRA